MTLIFRIVFFAKKRLLLEYSKKNTFSSEPGRMKTLFAKKNVSFTYIFVKFFFNANKQKYIYSTQIQKKAISKFKKNRNNNIFYEKSKFYLHKLIFTIYNYIFILYLCYYLFFLGFLLKLSNIRLGIKSLFR